MNKHEEEKEEERRKQEAAVWKSYYERLEAWKKGTLPMPPSEPVRYPFG